MRTRLIAATWSLCFVAALMLGCPTPVTCPEPDAGVEADAGPEPQDITLYIVNDAQKFGQNADGTDTPGTVAESAVKFAIEEAGGKIDINGSRIKSVTLATRQITCVGATAGVVDPVKCMKEAVVQTADPKVIAFWGSMCGSDTSQLYLPITNAGKLLQMSTISYSGLTTTVAGVASEPDRYYPTGKRTFGRFGASDDEFAVVTAKWMKKLGATKVYIVHDNVQPARNSADTIEAQLVPNGMTLAGKATDLSYTGTVSADVATRIATAGADHVYIANNVRGDASNLIKAIRANASTATIPIQVFNYWARNTSMISAAGAGANTAVYGVSLISKDRYAGKALAFYDAMKAKYKVDVWTETALAKYEATKLLIATIKAAGDKADDRETIAKAFLGTKNYDGVLGTWSFDANGDMGPNVFNGYTVSALNWVYNEGPLAR